jgi:hypothetical protein
MRFVLFVLPAFLSSCAAPYKPPTTVTLLTPQSASTSKANLLSAAKQVLVAEGFEITNSDDSAGVISTAPRELRLSPAQADCGGTLRIDYVKDNRTTTRVRFDIIAEDSKLVITTTIDGEHRPAAAD